jgi:hypothetical protein
MPTPSRFDRDLEIEVKESEPVSRFERIDSEIRLVDRKVIEGSTLIVKSKEGRVIVSLQPEKVEGSYPSFRIGLQSIGEKLNGDSFDSDIPGECRASDPLDKELLSGFILYLTQSGVGVQAVWSKNLPNREYKVQGKDHLAYRKGIRKARATTILEAAEKALEAMVEIEEGSLLI